MFGTDRKQELLDIDLFCDKIRAGKAAQVGEDFMVIARMESLIAGWGEEEALMRAEKCIAAGADGIMIHSKEKSPDEVRKRTKDVLTMISTVLVTEDMVLWDPLEKEKSLGRGETRGRGGRQGRRGRRGRRGRHGHSIALCVPCV